MIIHLAQETRHWCEKNSKGLYPTCLEGICHVASVKLWLMTYIRDIPLEIGCTVSHAFNIDPIANRVIDITATQYGYDEKILIFDLIDIEDYPQHENYDLVDQSWLQSINIDDMENVESLISQVDVWSHLLKRSRC